MTENSQTSGLTPIVRRMSLFLICVLLFEVLSIAVAPRLHSGSVLKVAKDCVFLRIRLDSWRYMAQADWTWRQYPNAIYETTFFENDIRFIYPPTALLLYRAWQAARVVGIAPFFALKLTLLFALLGTWWVSSTFFFDMLPIAAMKNSSARERWAVRILIAVLICTFLPLINALFLGQVQTILNFLLMASALLWLRGRHTASGVLIGLTCWLKPQMALFLIWGLLRRRWNFVISLAIMIAVGMTLSCVVFGIHNTIEYVAVLRYLSQRGDALFTNQSLNGLLHRQMHVGSPVTWIYGYPPYNPFIYWATVISSAVLLLTALIVPVMRRMAATPVDFFLFAMAVTMASPIAWEHHYGVFFLVFLMWMPEAFRNRRIFLWLLAAYLLMTDNWAPVTLLMYTRWTFLISHVYFGGLVLFVLTLLMRANPSFSCRERTRQPYGTQDFDVSNYGASRTTDILRNSHDELGMLN